MGNGNGEDLLDKSLGFNLAAATSQLSAAVRPQFIEATFVSLNVRHLGLIKCSKLGPFTLPC